MFRPFSRKAAASENATVGVVDHKIGNEPAKRARAFGRDISNTNAVPTTGADVFKNPLSVLTSVTGMTLAAVGAGAAVGSASTTMEMQTETVSDPNRPYMDRPSDDIDSRDADNPLLVTEYVNEMYEIFSAMEKEQAVSPDYMAKQQSINEKMRTILVDWLVSFSFPLHPQQS